MRLTSKPLLVATTAAALLALTPVVHADTAPAVHGQVVAPPLGAAAGFVTRTAVVPVGTPADFLNLDTQSHNVRSDAKDPVTGVALFASNSVSSGSAPIVGVEALPAGTYGFRCSIHPNMTGTLVVQ